MKRKLPDFIANGNTTYLSMRLPWRMLIFYFLSISVIIGTDTLALPTLDSGMQMNDRFNLSEIVNSALFLLFPSTNTAMKETEETANLAPYDSDIALSSILKEISCHKAFGTGGAVDTTDDIFTEYTDKWMNSPCNSSECQRTESDKAFLWVDELTLGLVLSAWLLRLLECEVVAKSGLICSHKSRLLFRAMRIRCIECITQLARGDNGGVECPYSSTPSMLCCVAIRINSLLVAADLFQQCYVSYFKLLEFNKASSFFSLGQIFSTKEKSFDCCLCKHRLHQGVADHVSGVANIFSSFLQLTTRSSIA